MANEKDLEKQKDAASQTDEKTEKAVEKTSDSGFLQWIIMAVVVVLCAGAGFGLGRLFAGSRMPATAEAPEPSEPATAEDLRPDTSATDSRKAWYYDLEPVVANLNEPGVRRYIRVTLTLAINPQFTQKKGVAFLDEKKPLLTNWLTIYLASLSIDDIRGDRNLRRVQSQILDAFNEKLFPDAKPQIKDILFKEFAVQ
ncbi:MAG TPA: flagellar basal body-associated FliL family protein [Sedimentisphaerales bacterium]|nr:flagellar basal body-associated FliL family protein [Sedimentisphaerales bacterium]